MERVERQVVLQVLGVQHVLGPAVALERFIAPGVVRRGPAFPRQAAVRLQPPERRAVDVGQDQVAVRRQRDLLRQMPKRAV